MVPPNVGKSKVDVPKISANDLALYMVSTDTAKLGIIRRHKYPSFHATTPYQKVKKNLITYLASDLRNRQMLASAEKELDDIIEMGGSTSKVKDARLSKEVLSAFEGAHNELGMSKLSYSLPSDKYPALDINGVLVSVTIDLILRKIYRGEDRIGGVVLRLTKPAETEATSDKRKEMADFIAALVFMQLSEQKSISEKVDANICLAYDVQQKIVGKIKSNSQRIRNIKSACQMITAVWPSVYKPE